MTKYDKIHVWYRKNQDKITVVGVGLVVVGLLFVVVKSDKTYREQMNAQLNAHIDELNALFYAKEITEEVMV